VSGDAAFPEYNSVATNSDLALFRGMLLRVSFPAHVVPIELCQPVPDVLCKVQQAFLPKFDIRRSGTHVSQTSSAEKDVATEIQSAAAEHFMLVSTKHSGHLATLSDSLISSKSSVASIHCAAAVVLLHAHFARVAAGCHGYEFCRPAVCAETHAALLACLCTALHR
jgi:hypothetical protein